MNLPNLPLKTMMKSKYKYLLCRLCLCKSGSLCDIHSCEEGQGYTAADCISQLLQFNVSKTDGYPQLVCLECLNKLYDFKKFKERCQNAKSKFEMDFHSNPKFLHALKSEEKVVDQELMLEGDDFQIQSIQRHFKDDSLAQEEKDFSCNYYVKIEQDQELDEHEVEEEDQKVGQWDPITLAPQHGDECSESPNENMNTDPYTKKPKKESDLLFKEENSQESIKQLGKMNMVEEETENVVASPRSPSFPPCICIIESDEEHREGDTNQERESLNAKVTTPPKKGSRREFRCEICQKSYAQKSTLTTHMNIHLGLKPFQCEVCKMGFLQSSKLKLHTLRKHAERKFQCSLCPRRFPTENSLARHTRTHREHRPFQCKLCICGFYTEKALERHTAKHALEVPFQCDECMKEFDHKRKISRHIWQSHMTKPYLCSICNRTFIKESVLREHMTLHTGEKNYMCEVCGKAFRKKRYLTIHDRVHTGEKPYLCELCNKRFTQRGSLVAHMKLHSR